MVQEVFKENGIKLPLDPSEYDIHVNVFREPLIFLDLQIGIGPRKCGPF